MGYPRLACEAVHDSARTRLVARSSVDGDALVVCVAGELDLDGTASVANACMQGLHRSVTVDLHGLTFMDCAGYSGLVRARNAVVERDGTFALTNATDQPARLLAVIEMAAEPSPATRAGTAGQRVASP